MSRAKAVYRALLRSYPAPFRHEYGEQMCGVFAKQLEDARRSGSRRIELALWAQAVRDTFTVAPREHAHIISEDLRYALRVMLARPGFACVAIASLALGIGANSAIFSLWRHVAFGLLAGVRNPEHLVVLTSPDITGMWRGRSTGARDLVSFGEFEQLAGRTTAFASMTAVQGTTTRWLARVDNGPVEEMHGRLVSMSFFDVLGVRTGIGRLFTARKDAAGAAVAVISDGYWQRRFSRDPAALGRTVTIHDTAVTIVGVTAAGFLGASRGEQTDIWLPLDLQPRVIPGFNWLRDHPPDIVMWLHVFGRLKPGVALSQGEAEANAVLRTHLADFYGTVGDERQRAEWLDQFLRVSSGARGLSGTVQQFSSSLIILLALVAVLLLIACVNLANLLLARGAARQTEIAVRVSLGASRTRIVRQLVTESMALAALGGVAAVLVTALLHSVLVRVLQAAEPRLFIDFEFDLPLLGFAIAATVLAAIAFGLLPAWQMTQPHDGSRLKDMGRGAINSMREMRAGRWLAGAQISLVVPLLVCGGLLVRTVYHLQHPQLGFSADGLKIVQISLGAAAENIPRRDRALRTLLQELEREPGIEAVTFSQRGVLGSLVSSAAITVEGSALTADKPLDVGLDRVGANYVTTLGIPVRMGRDISPRDGANSPRVCIINDAFARRFFDQRHPLGARVTTVADDGARVAYEVIGVVADSRTHNLRGTVEPAFFVPAEQRDSGAAGRSYLIRTSVDAPALTSAVRAAIGRVDPALSLTSVATVGERVAVLTAEERTLAQLAAMFGVVALALAALGLYGMLCHGVSRRSHEIAVRVALGAQSRAVVFMIFRESLLVVIAGLIAGSALAYGASRLIASRLYGVAAQDPVTFAVTAAVVMVVTIAAVYSPARRASKVHPMTVLHRV